MKYFIKVFGCAANTADAERISAVYVHKGWTPVSTVRQADVVILVTCMVRQSAENRIYGMIRNLSKEKERGRKIKIILTGCMVGMALRDTTGKLLSAYKKRMPAVDGFLSIEEIGLEWQQLRSEKNHALVLISNGCNNFCSYCVVPYARGKERSRPLEDILTECAYVSSHGYGSVTLVGQNVNSYGADLMQKTLERNVPYKYERNTIHPVMVKHLGKYRIPTLFPFLLDKVCRISGIREVDFISSNPWDFSDELIGSIARNPKIKRVIHLPVQSGDREILKRMNRWYTPAEYIMLTKKIRKRIPDIRFSTDVIVGFPGETEEQFQHTLDLCKKVRFTKAYISMYSDRPMTVAHKTMKDSVPYIQKKQRWEILDELINKTNIRNGTYE